MRNFIFKPGYYEWHLIDADTEQTLHNMVDPSENICYEDGTPMTLDEIIDFCFCDLDCADTNYADNDDYNGIQLEGDDRLSLDEMKNAADLMGKILYEYYYGNGDGHSDGIELKF